MMYSFLNGLLADRYLVAGTLAGALSVAAFAPYIRDILRGKTQPDRACWLIWAVLASISGASHFHVSTLSGIAGTSLLFVGVQVVGSLIVFALSIRFGQGAFFNGRNCIILAVAGLGLISWALMDTAAYALALSIGVSALGGGATMWKVYRAPQTETASAWWVMLGAAGFGVYSVGGFDPMMMAYPVYLMVLYAVIVGVQVFGRIAQAHTLSELERVSRRLVIPQISTQTPRAKRPIRQERASVRIRHHSENSSGRAPSPAAAPAVATRTAAV